MPEPKLAGDSTRAMAARRRRTAIVVAVVILLIMAIIALIFQSKILAGFGGLSLALLVLLRILPTVADRETSRLRKAELQALRGAVGEEVVASSLAGLGEGFFILHDVESPYGNIDHIVLARSGAVCLVETKAHHGRVSVVNGAVLMNGKPPEKDLLGQALRNSAWLGEQLAELCGGKIWASPFLVFANAFVPRLPPVRGVRIMNKRYLVSEIARLAKPASEGGRVWEIRADLANFLSEARARHKSASRR